MMKKKRNGQTEPLLEALRPLDQINSLPPSLSPTQISSRLRLQTPQPAKRRGLTLRHVAVAAAALAIVIGAIALWKGLPYLEVVNRQTGDSAPLTEVLQDYSKIESYFKDLSAHPADESIAGREEAMKAPAESPTMKPTMNDVPEDNALAGQATNNSATVNEADTGYGKTNIQTAGVEEADILKNDGSTLYFVPALGKTIQIIAPRPAGSMKVLSQISIPQESNKEVTVSELYVQGNRLIAICRLTNPSGSTVYNEMCIRDRSNISQGSL